jgi:hypothetical protein
MRCGLLVVVLAGCSPGVVYRGAPAPPPGLFRDVVVGAPATTVNVSGAVALDDGGIAVLACVGGNLPGWPSGGALARIAPDGNVAVVVAAAGCHGEHLVRAGNDLVVAHAAGRRETELVVTRFDRELRSGAASRTVVAGPLEAIAGRADGSIVVATLADMYEHDPRVELAIIARDGTDVSRAQLRGGDVTVSELIADGDGFVAVGLVKGDAKLEADLSIAAPTESAFALGIGATRWARVIGAPGIGPISYLAPRIVKVGDGFVMTWSVEPTGYGQPHAALDPFGEIPSIGGSRLYVRLDHGGAVVRGRLEPTGIFEGVDALALQPDGSILEQRTQVVDYEPRAGCLDAHGCAQREGPEAYGKLHTLVITRRDPTTLESREHVTVGGKMMFEHVQVVQSVASIVAVGTFVGTIELPRGRITSPTSEQRPCNGNAQRQGSGTLFATEPPVDPCQVEVVHHGAVFAVRLHLH